MFSPDDMVSRYENCYLLKGRKERVLLFPDFLSGCVSGDFIHVMNPDILRHHPFNEFLRIYEGVFFFLFYREAKRILFTNKIVAIRERSRNDSATKETFRTSKLSIKRNTISKELSLKWFEHDYINLGLIDALSKVYEGLVDNYLLLEKYMDAARCIKALNFYGNKIKLLHKVVFKLHIGRLYRYGIKLYLFLKYSIL